MGNLVFQAASGGQVAVSGPNTASSFTINIPTVSGTFVTTGDTGTVTTTMLASTTGSGAVVLATSPTLVTPALGTPASGVMTNVTGLPLTTGVTGTLPVTNGGTGVTTSTGSGSNVLNTSPTLVTPVLGTPTSVTLTNATGLPLTTGVTGTLPVANGGTNLTSFTANGVVYASSTSALATGSALTWDGTSAFKLTVSNPEIDLIDTASSNSALRLVSTGSTSYIQSGISGGSFKPLVFTSNGGGTEIARFNASGYLGIGTSSPSSILTVNGRVTLTSSGSEVYTSDASGLYLTAATPAGMYVASDGTFYFRKASSPYTEYMRIDTSGRLLIGTTSAVINESCIGAVTSGNAATFKSTGNGNNPLLLWNSYGSGTVNQVTFFYGASYAAVGSITSTSTGTLYNVTSDQRLKTNIVDAPHGNIDVIKVRSFDWLSDGSHQEYGLVAQELLEIAPYAVSVPSDPEKMMGVDYSKLVPMMIKEIQSLKQRILTLENK